MIYIDHYLNIIFLNEYLYFPMLQIYLEFSFILHTFYIYFADSGSFLFQNVDGQKNKFYFTFLKKPRNLIFLFYTFPKVQKTPKQVLTKKYKTFQE